MSLTTVLQRTGRWLLFALVLGLLLFILYAGTPADQRAALLRLQAASPDAIDTSVLVVARARFEPADGLIAVADGTTLGGRHVRVQELLVREGDWVDSGAPLAILDTRERARTGLAEAQAALRAAGERRQQAAITSGSGGLAALQATVDRLTREHAYAAGEHDRARELLRVGYCAPAEVDARRVAMESAAAELRRAEAELAQQTKLRASALQAADADVTAAAARVAALQYEMDEAVLTAPAAGRVLRIFARTGEALGPDGLLQLGNTATMDAIAEVWESEVHLLRPGVRARLSSEALPAPLTGTVTDISRSVRRPALLDLSPTAPADNRVVEVRVRLAEAETAGRFTGLNVRCTFLR